jgi:hypothetical protein
MSVFRPKTVALPKNLSISNGKCLLFLLNADVAGPTISVVIAFTPTDLNLPKPNWTLRDGKPTRAGYVLTSPTKSAGSPC